LFPRIENVPVWPDPPEQPRIRYIGQLSLESDLRPQKDLGQAVAEAIFGKREAAGLLNPYAICTDSANRLFVADAAGQVVHVIDLERRKWTRLVPNVRPKRFGHPVALAYDATPPGRLFVVDSVDHCIYVFSRGEKYARAIGSEYLTRPCGIAFDESAGRLLVVDAAAHEVIALTPDGQLIERRGRRGTQPGEFNYPTNIAIDSTGRIYVSDSLNFRVQQLNNQLQPLQVFGKKGDMPGYFAQPKGLAVDSDDHLYVVDANFESVQIFDEAGQLMLHFGEEGRKPGEFWLPAGICFDRPSNRIWVADTYNKRVQAFEYLSQSSPQGGGEAVR
jgi:DNA-binding beta-propeller fold protein YncE